MFYVVFHVAQKSRWKGPLPGCPNSKRHPAGKCRECKAAWMREARASGKWPWASTQATRARAVVKMAIRRGTMKREPCEICGEPEAQAHHLDYRKPKQVRWLCDKHNKMAHSGRLTLPPKL